MVSIGRSVEISRWIGGSDPLPKIFARLVPYTRGQTFLIGGGEVRRLRTVQIADIFKHVVHIVAYVSDIFVNTCGDHQGFCLCHKSLLLREFVQPLKRVIETIYSEKPLGKLLCGKRPYREYMNEEWLTDSALLNFLRCDSEDRNNLDHDLNNDGHHGCRRLDGNVFFKPHKEKLHVAEHVDKSILSSANILNGLRDNRSQRHPRTANVKEDSLGAGLQFR